MKNLFSILILMVSFNLLNAQVEFPVLNARWCYHGYGDTGEDLGNYCFSPSELVEFNGKTYSKIVVTNTPYSNPSEEVLYREENGKFYLIPENETEERLLYDFNLIVGDTFVATYGWGVVNDSITLEVETVDTVVTLDGVSRKRITLVNGNGKYGRWLEGIGSLDWTFTYPGYAASLSGWLSFICHSQGTETIYPSSGNIDCNLIIKTDDLKENLSFEIYPNPVEDVLNVDFKNINAKSLVIVSLTGKVILEKNIGPEQNKLQFSINLEAGIYFAKVYSNEGEVVTKKFIKI